MAKFTHPTSYQFLTGENVLESKSFIYQVTLYKYSKNCIELLDTKYYSSSTYLEIKNNFKKIKGKNCFYVKYINIIGVPKSFIIDYALEVSKEPIKKKKK